MGPGVGAHRAAVGHKVGKALVVLLVGLVGRLVGEAQLPALGGAGPVGQAQVAQVVFVVVLVGVGVAQGQAGQVYQAALVGGHRGGQGGGLFKGARPLVHGRAVVLGTVFGRWREPRGCGSGPGAGGSWRR